MLVTRRSPSARRAVHRCNGCTPGGSTRQIEETFSVTRWSRCSAASGGADLASNPRTKTCTARAFGAAFLCGLILPVTFFIGNLNYVAIAVVGGLRVAQGAMTLGDVQAFMQYTGSSPSHSPRWRR